MTLIVKTTTRIIFGFVLLYGIYIGLCGHASPGGGFAGGAIIALSFILIMLAFGKEVAIKKFSASVLRILTAASGLLFLYVMTISYGGSCAPINILVCKVRPCAIFNNEIVIPLCEMVIVGLGIFTIFIALVIESKADKESE